MAGTKRTSSGTSKPRVSKSSRLMQNYRVPTRSRKTRKTRKTSYRRKRKLYRRR